MKPTTLFFLFISSIVHADTYTGLIIPPLPTDAQDLGGALLNHQPGKEAEWSQQLVKINNSYYLWLNSFESRKEKKAYFKVVHHLKLPALNKNEYIYLALCKNTRTKEKEITGIGYGKTNEEWHSHISGAWKSNLKTGVIESISTDDIICYNEGYGI